MQKTNVISTKNLSKLKLSILFIAIIFITINLPILKYNFNKCAEKQTLSVLQSNCECFKWQKIVIVENHNCEKEYSGTHFYISY